MISEAQVRQNRQHIARNHNICWELLETGRSVTHDITHAYHLNTLTVIHYSQYSHDWIENTCNRIRFRVWLVSLAWDVRRTLLWPDVYALINVAEGEFSGLQRGGRDPGDKILIVHDPP